MLYELLSGRLPFSEEGGGLAIVYRHVHDEPIRLEDAAPDVPVSLAEVVMRALARSQTQRYATAEEFGVAVGEAASASFGAGWLLVDRGPGCWRRDVSRPASNHRPPGVSPPAPSVSGNRQPETIQVAGAPDGYGASRPTADTRRDVTIIRPRVTDHVGGGSPDHQGGGPPDHEPPVPVRHVLDLPPWPWVLSLATVGATVLVVVAGFLGAGAPPPTRARCLPAQPSRWPGTTSPMEATSSSTSTTRFRSWSRACPAPRPPASSSRLSAPRSPARPPARSPRPPGVWRATST